MHNWLDEYAYRIDLNIFPFVVVAIIMMMLVAILISATVRKIAVTSPVNSLRTE
jgi:putative ABC transport system permease protein